MQKRGNSQFQKQKVGKCIILINYYYGCSSQISLWKKRKTSSRYLWSSFTTCRTRVTISSLRQWGRSWSVLYTPPPWIHPRFPFTYFLPRKKITCTRSERNTCFFLVKADIWQWGQNISLKENSPEVFISNNCKVTLVAEVMPAVRTCHLIAS